MIFDEVKARIYKSFLLSFFWLLAGQVGAQNLLPANQQLKIFPISCVVQAEGQPCTEQITLMWALPDDEPFCIYIRMLDSVERMSCHAQQQGRVSLQYPVYHNALVMLVSERTQATITQGEILVSKLNKPNRRTRNRHAWSIF